MSEKAAFDNPPIFDFRERKKFFEFPKPLLELANSLRNPVYQVCFLVSCGYFRAARRFFSPVDFYQRDVAYVASQFDVGDVTVEAYPDRTRQRHQKFILEFYGFLPFDINTEATLTLEIAAMARTHLKPRLIFDRCVDFLTQKRIQVPRARTLSDLIRSGLHERKAELIAMMDSNLTDETRCLLDDLFSSPDDQKRYRLTLLKKLSQSTKPSRIKECIADYKVLFILYKQLDSIFSVLDLGHAGIRYYAGSVIKSRIFQLQRRSEADRYIHATAFVAHQFFRIQDNLIDILLNVMASFQTTVSRKYKERLFEQRKGQQAQLKTVVDDLDSSIFCLIQEIRSLADSASLSDSQKISEIKLLLERGKTSSFEHLKNDLENAGQNQIWSEVLEDQSKRLQNRLNPILKALVFEPAGHTEKLMAAIEHFKIHDGVINDQAPVGFLDADKHGALTRADGSFRPSLYKVFLFQHIAGAIKSGNLNASQSYKYRPMDTYLIDQVRWKHEKQHLLERAGLIEFDDPEPLLEVLKEALYTQYQTTNARILENQHLKFRADGTFYIATSALDVSDTDPLHEIFPQRHDVPLAQVLETIDRHCSMLNSFEDWQQTHTRQSNSHPTLLAGIIGLGCNIGVRKMARISSQITESELEHAVNWRFSIDNIRAANDKVLKTMDEMELPNIYRRNTDRLHTASDGQKFEVRGDSLHASRSFKYFGQGQGVSSYTFVDERNLLWHSLVISAAERESTYVIDGLMHNDVIKSDIHSTDTHDYTEAIFGLTHLLGFSFAPRIKGIGKQTLYIFRPKKKARMDWKIPLIRPLVTR
ncbi:MAG: Tn3 family transposase [Desulfuromusa sp.]|nr:Tn3 family transposase [Desulfuromusa sp.]